MMTTEGVALVGVGTAVGAGLGWLLAQITLPLLAVTLSASMGGSTEATLLPDWLALGQLLLVMLALYLLAVLAVAWLNGRVEIARLLRWGM
jgi:ABC-type antimicrobial peptide transport system permease subunit